MLITSIYMVLFVTQLRCTTTIKWKGYVKRRARGECSTEHLVCLSVCLSAPTQDFEQNRLVYGLYLLRMSQKFKNISLCLPHERERTSGSREKQTFTFWALLKLPFKSGDLFMTTIITIAQAQVNCNQAIVLAYAFAC